MNDYRKYLDPEVISKISSLELRAKLVVEGFITGLHKSPYHGFSVEFAEHRHYQPGDELKHVDWKVYARTDKYFIKQFEEETNLRCWIVVDASSSMSFASEGNPTKYDYAISLAAALATLMMKQHDAVGVALFDSDLKSILPPRSKTSYLRELLKSLVDNRPSASMKTETSKSLRTLAERVKRRGLVIVISDFLDEIDEVSSALRGFRYAQNEVLAIQLLDPIERSFDFSSPSSFRDLETGEKISTAPQHLRAEYEHAVKEFTTALKRSCHEHSIDYTLIDTSTPFDVALMEYVKKRRKRK